MLIRTTPTEGDALGFADEDTLGIVVGGSLCGIGAALGEIVGLLLNNGAILTTDGCRLGLTEGSNDPANVDGSKVGGTVFETGFCCGSWLGGASMG